MFYYINKKFTYLYWNSETNHKKKIDGKLWLMLRIKGMVEYIKR